MINAFLLNRTQAMLRCVASDGNLLRFRTQPIPQKVIPPPFPASLYRRFLSEWRQAGVVLLPLPARIQGVRTMALRHDLDRYPERARVFLEAEAEEHVAGAYYFIADGVVEGYEYEYSLEDFRQLADDVRSSGGLIGLHSIAWAQPQPIEVLDRERRRFADAFGCLPQAWTHHGFMDASKTKLLRARFEFRHIIQRGRQFTQARLGVISDSAGRSLPESLPAECLATNFPNEFMTHSDYWLPDP